MVSGCSRNRSFTPSDPRRAPDAARAGLMHASDADIEQILAWLRGTLATERTVGGAHAEHSLL